MNIAPKSCSDSNTRGRVLYCTSPPGAASCIPQWIQECGYEVDVVTTCQQIIEITTNEPADIIVLDLQETSAGNDGSRSVCDESIAQLTKRRFDAGHPAQIILLASGSDPLPEVRRFGADDRVAKVFAGVFERPRHRDRLRALLQDARERSRIFAENQRLRWQLSNRCLRDVLGESYAIHQLLGLTQQAADSDQHVLICGERGTRKDLLAQAIHQGSRHRHPDFLQLDCRTMSSKLVEDELFGANGPASLGVAPKRSGCLDPATECDVVLSEIDHMSLPLQRRLGRYLHRQACSTNGDAHRVRVIGTTTCQSDEIVRRCGLSLQLYQQFENRILQVPALRDRVEDIELLAERFLDAWSLESGLPTKRISFDALKMLKRYSWPGNVRELQQLIRYACAMETSGWITNESIQPFLCGTSDDLDRKSSGISLKEMERKLIEATFNRYGGNREQTARTLKIGVRTLSGKLREYGYPPRGGPGSNRKAA